MMWCSACCFEATLHQILTELCRLEYFGKLFVSGQLLLQFTSDQAETWFIVRPWYRAAHIYSRLLSTKYQQSYVPLKFSVNFSFPPLTPPTVYIWSRLNVIYSKNMMWSSANYFKVTVHQILAELCPFENFCKFFVSGLFLLQFTSDQAETWFIVTPWSGAGHIILRLQSTIH